MECILVSACLLGFRCKYNGGTNILDSDQLSALKEKYTLIPVCPEVSGGLPVPRKPSERIKNHVINISHEDVSVEYNKGAQIALMLAKRYDCKKALLKEKSPSCGKGLIYDGSFSSTLVFGNGVTTELLVDNGISVYGEGELEMLI